MTISCNIISYMFQYEKKYISIVYIACDYFPLINVSLIYVYVYIGCQFQKETYKKLNTHTQKIIKAKFEYFINILIELFILFMFFLTYNSHQTLWVFVCGILYSHTYAFSGLEKIVIKIKYLLRII